MSWLGIDYTPGQWDLFRTRAGHDEHSQVWLLTIAEDGSIELPDGVKLEKRIGPTQELGR